MANQSIDDQFRMLRRGPWAVLDNHNATSYELVDTGAGNVNPVGFVEDGSVSGTSVTDGSITAAKLATDAVTNTKIQNAAVTNAKISDVDGSKIASASIADSKIIELSGSKLTGSVATTLLSGISSGSASFGTVTTATSETATITLSETMANATYMVVTGVVADVAATNELYAIVEARTTTTVDVRVVNPSGTDATGVFVHVIAANGI
jgi:hypothetical protein